MSGFEVAGLVLGAFPLVISGLQFYLEGISTITRYARYKKGLISILMAIKCEHRILQNACETLLQGVLPSIEIRRLLDDPSGHSWRRMKVQTALRSLLREDLAIFVHSLEEIKRMIGKISEKMRLTDGGDVSAKFEASLSLSNHGQVQFTDVNRFKQEYERIRFSIRKKDYEEIVQTIRDRVKEVRVMSDQSISLEPSRRIRSGPKLQLFRNCAASVYSLLSNSWKCDCRLDHAMSLSLVTSEINTDVATTADDTASTQPRFNIVFCSSRGSTTSAALWLHVETELRSSESPRLAVDGNRTSTSPGMKPGAINSALVNNRALKNTVVPEQPIEDLCEVLGNTFSPDQLSYVGFLLDKSTHIMHSIHTANEQPSSWYTISLKEVIDEKKRFPRIRRSRLAAELSLSLLRYAQTPWLQNQWNKDDISFVVEHDQIHFGRPFISTGLSTKVKNSIAFYRRAGIENESLFTMGILLIELWCGLTIDEICQQQHIGQIFTQTIASTDVSISWTEMEKLLSYLEDEAGEDYCVIVKVCIRCEIPGSKKDFEAGAFQDAVFSNVVYPLWRLYASGLKLDPQRSI